MSIQQIVMTDPQKNTLQHLQSSIPSLTTANRIKAPLWTTVERDIIRQTWGGKGTDEDFRLFMATAERLKLDPLTKQIYATFRNSKQADNTYKPVMSIQIGIDGYRLIAQRTGLFEGMTSPQWCGNDGVWLDIWPHEGPPVAARVGVYRKGFREPLYKPVKYKNYVQTTKEGYPTSFWARNPEDQLAKCAEAAALRAAFASEMDAMAVPVNDGLDHERLAILDRITQVCVKKKLTKQFISKMVGNRNSEEMTNIELQQVLRQLEELQTNA
jgi:phage recombination protein Bet